MPRFEHLGGGAHHHDDGRVYKKGDILTTDVDLEKTFVGKWRRVMVAEAPIAPPTSTLPPPPPSEDKKKGLKIVPGAKAPTATGARGDEVTDEFPKIDESFKVFQRGDVYHVYEGDRTDPINKKGVGKDQVIQTVKDYLEE